MGPPTATGPSASAPKPRHGSRLSTAEQPVSEASQVPPERWIYVVVHARRVFFCGIPDPEPSVYPARDLATARNVLDVYEKTYADSMGKTVVRRHLNIDPSNSVAEILDWIHIDNLHDAESGAGQDMWIERVRLHVTLPLLEQDLMADFRTMYVVVKHVAGVADEKGNWAEPYVHVVGVWDRVEDGLYWVALLQQVSLPEDVVWGVVARMWAVLPQETLDQWRPVPTEDNPVTGEGDEENAEGEDDGNGQHLLPQGQNLDDVLHEIYFDQEHFLGI